MFAYLIAASTSGGAQLLYPNEGTTSSPATAINVPDGEDEWLPLSPPAGTETIVLLARPNPLPDAERFVGDLLSLGPAPELDGIGLWAVDEAGPRLYPSRPERPLGAKPVTVQKDFLEKLLKSVPDEWTLVRALSFPQAADDPAP